MKFYKVKTLDETLDEVLFKFKNATYSILFNKLLKGAIGPNWLSKLLCKCGFEPVNLVNGAVIYEGSDFDFTSPIPLNWERRWYSDSEYIGWLGHGVHCSYDRAVELFPEDDALGLRMDDGRLVAFPLLQPDEEFYLRQEKITLKKVKKGYEAYNHDNKLTYIFNHFFDNKYQLAPSNEYKERT